MTVRVVVAPLVLRLVNAVRSLVEQPAVDVKVRHGVDLVMGDGLVLVGTVRCEVLC